MVLLVNFYNDIDPKACAWTQELINAKLIPEGVVACKSITEIKPDELRNFSHVHFFNGISGWAKALDLAGWPSDRPVWCASLPCQSFSCAGKGEGFDDERGQLWFPFLGLVRECRPDTIFGEQVPAAIGKGWLDRVFTDLEKEGYRCGAVVLGAHSVGAPHRRQRLYWVAHAKSQRRPGVESQCEAGVSERSRIGGSRPVDAVDNSSSPRQQSPREGAEVEARNEARMRGPQCGCGPVALGDTQQPGLEGHAGDGADGSEPGRLGAQEGRPATAAGGVGPWSNYRVLHMLDGKARRIEPTIFPLAPGISGRVGLLRGAGNAIVPEVAAEFIRAFLEVT